MIINEELFVLEDQCKRLAKCIIESHTMSEYMKTKKQMEQSEEVAKLKADFFKKKEDYEKIAPYKEYAPGFLRRSRLMQAILSLKKEDMLDVEETVMETENNQFEITKRRGLIVWVYSLKQLKNLKKFGLLHYVSRKMKYVVIYLNEETFDQTEERIKKLHFVRNVERSYRPDIEMNFAEKIGSKAHVKDDGFEVEEANTKIRLADHVF